MIGTFIHTSVNTPSPFDTPVRVAVVGCGNFARRQHLPNLARMPTAQLRWVCDVSKETAVATARAFGAVSHTSDLDTILSDPETEAVILTVRDDLQANLGEKVLRAGKHLYVEKPAAQTEEQFDKLIAARDACGARAVVGFQKRFSPGYAAARRALLADGGPHNLFIRMADDAWRWAHGYPPGALLHHDACHLFDLTRLFTGSEVRSVFCAASRPDDDALLLVFENGATATMLHSGLATMDFPKERFEAITRRGGVIMDDYVETRVFGIPGLPPLQTHALVSAETGEPVQEEEGLAAFLSLRRKAWEDWTAKGGVPEVIPNFLRNQGWYAAMEAFLVSLRGGKIETPHASLEDARAAARVATAACQSRERGTPVNPEEAVHG